MATTSRIDVEMNAENFATMEPTFVAVKQEIIDPEYDKCQNINVEVEMIPIKSEPPDDYEAINLSTKDNSQSYDPHMTIKKEMDINKYMEMTMTLPQTNTYIELADNKNIIFDSQPQTITTIRRRRNQPRDVPEEELLKLLTVEKRKYSCNLCPKVFVMKGFAIKHALEHREKKIHCEYCNKVLFSPYEYSMHVLIHKPKTEFRCKRCFKTFKIQYHLTKHLKVDKCSEDYVCQVCKKTFKKLNTYKNHVVLHDLKTCFICDLCKMPFKCKSKIIKHLKSHRLKSYQCDICNKKFTQNGLLQAHMCLHTGVKPYPCPVCQKMFTLKHNVKKHMVTHVREKKLTCELCNKKFPRESRLKYHMRIHTKDKPFSCDICQKCFSHKQNILRHFVSKHPDRLNSQYVSDTKSKISLWDAISNLKKREFKAAHCILGV